MTAVTRTSPDLSLEALEGYDAIIDVRSPGEFAHDHLPGAINLPVLDDRQRAEVGTLYVQRSKFLARRTGAAYVAHNIADHLQGALADREGGFRPLVYCWRGGQRSSAMVTVMEQVGWPVTRLDGGYQTWRRQVVRDLYDGPDGSVAGLTLILLDGYTGTGKTAVLNRLSSHGIQTLDLEAIAAHRGSLFGATRHPQPGQKMFESRLADALRRFNREQPIIIEAESSKVGRLALPPALWSAMKVAPRIELAAPLDVRVAHILETYSAIGTDVEALDAALLRLPRHHSRDTIAAWRAMGQAGKFATITGKGYRPRIIRLGKWRYPAFGLFLLYFLFTIAAPTFVLLWRSLLRFYVKPSFNALSFLTLEHYWHLFTEPDIFQATMNTIWIGLGTATLTMVLSLVVAWVVIRKGFRGKVLLDGVTFLPHSLPGVIIGIAFIFGVGSF